MFTAKDLEVYKDSLKEKKSTSTKTGEKPVKTPTSVTRISKPPLKLQNEDPNKERKPLSVVYKASNTLKDTHKPPSPTPVGSSKHADPVKKPKEIVPKSPSPAGKLHTTEADSFVEASEFRSDPLRSPRQTLLSKSPSIKAEENKLTGVRKLKEPSTQGANGIYQKVHSLSGAAKAAPAVDVNASLCSECTRAASEGAVCFIGNDGRVSACTTRSAVRLCKNLNCAANNPEYVAAMANAPKKYLISKRHLLKAQYAPKSRSSRPKSPNLQQIDAGGDALSPSNGEMSSINVDMSLKNHPTEYDDGGPSPVANGDLGLSDDDLSLFHANVSFSEHEMGDVVMGMKEEHGIAGVDCDRVQNGGAAIDEQNDFSFLEGEAGETESPKFSTSGSPKEQIEEGNGYVDDNLHTFGRNNSEELDDEDTNGSLMHIGSMADESAMKDPLIIADATVEQVIDDDGDARGPIDISQVGDDGGLVVNDQVPDIRPTIDINQMGDDTWFDDSVPPTDMDHVADGEQSGGEMPMSDTKQVTDDEQSGGVTPMSDTKQVTDDDQIDDIVSTITVAGSEVVDVTSGGFMAPDTNQVADDERGGDITPPVDTHVAHDEQSNVNDSEDHEQSGEITSLTHGHVADDDHDDDETPVNGTYVVDDASSGVITSLNNVITSEADDHGDDISLNGTHVADAEPNDDISSLNGTHVADAEPNDDITPLNDRHVADDDHDDDRKSLHLKHDADDDQNDGITSLHDRHVSLQNRHDTDDDQNDGITSLHDRHVSDDDESDGDDNEVDEPDAIVGDTLIAEDDGPRDSQNGIECTLDVKGNGGEEGSATSGGKKGSTQRRRRVLGIVEESNPGTVTLRKQQTQERKQAEEWMLNYAIEGVVHKLAPTGEAKVKILVEAFESIISNTEDGIIDSQNASKQK